MTTILIIDDEPGIRSAIKGILEDEGYTAVVAEDAIVGIELLAHSAFSLVILDVWLPRMGGIEALEEIKRLYPELPVVVISGHGNVEMAVHAIRLGAYDFIEKPLSIERLLTSTRNALETVALRSENQHLKRKGPAPEEVPSLLGESAAMAEIRGLAEQAATSEARVLITGENGTGKELLARYIHAKSGRAAGPFIALNCAAIPEGLIDSELFGHEKGAFTDAIARRIGRFEAADHGTLFLDEVADLSLSAQSKLLRVLQEMRFERVGGEKSIEVDVRVIAATNKDVQTEVASGRFREDLYFRLAVLPLRMPSLRERKEDIGLLCRSFLEAEGGKTSLSPAAETLLATRDWPGNVRELKNAMERLRVLSTEDFIEAETIQKVLGLAGSPGAAGGRVSGEERQEGRSPRSLPYIELRFDEALEQFERDYLAQKLKERDYNIAKTAEAIGITTNSLYAKIKKLGIEQGK